ncbi:MAG: universal stress protein [Actinomycetota bacterium]|nr:universal stress protein [Actinomycetota bacterium]
MTTSLTRILLATDGSEEAALAGRAAADISNKTAAELHVVHVWTDVPPPASPSPSLDNYSRLAKEEATRLLRREAWNARVAGSRMIREHLCEGRPAEEIIALAEELDADLVVVGSRRAGRIKRLITGSVSEHVVHRASCPVLVICGGEGAWPAARVIVADDGSGPARKAGDLAAKIANLFGAEVVVVRAYEHPPEPVGGWSAQDRRELDEALWRNRRDLKVRAEQLEEIAPCRPKTRLIKSKAAAAINLVAEEGEERQTLFAVGSRGLRAPERALFGSVSTAVLRAADGPVLIVPSETASARRSRGTAREANEPETRLPIGLQPESENRSEAKRVDRRHGGDTEPAGAGEASRYGLVAGGKGRASSQGDADRRLRRWASAAGL